MEAVHGNLSHAMRDNYNEHGVDEYYRKVAATYRNPFFPGIKKVVFTLMNRWWEAEGRDMFMGSPEAGEYRRELRFLDMAAGSGEATLCLLEWAQTGVSHGSNMPSSTSLPNPLALLRSNPLLPVDGTSRPAFIPPNRKPVIPHSLEQSSHSPKSKQVFRERAPLDLPTGFTINVVATDPYTSPAYTDRTTRPCYPLSFTDLAQGELPPQPIQSVSIDAHEAGQSAEPVWDMIICSFALHLVTNPSELFALLYELSGKAKWLIVVAPHKKPDVKESWGWSRWDIASWTAAGEDKLYGGGGGKGNSKGDGEDEQETELEIVRDKVKLRLYRSNAF